MARHEASCRFKLTNPIRIRCHPHYTDLSKHTFRALPQREADFQVAHQWIIAPACGPRKKKTSWSLYWYVLSESWTKSKAFLIRTPA